MAVVAMVVVTGGVVAVIMAVVATAVVLIPGKGSGENPEKSSLRRKKGIPLGFPMQEGVRVGVINAPFDTLPA